MVSKVLVALCIVVAAASAIPAQPGWPVAGPQAYGGWPPAGGMNPWFPSWLATAPWYPQWSPCTAVGPTCQDCTTKLVCTKIGGLQRACTDPALPYCNLGECSATPSEQCAPVEAAAPATVA